MMENIATSMEDRLNLEQIDMLEEIMKKCVNCIFNEYTDLEEFIRRHYPENRHDRTEIWLKNNECWRKLSVDKILKRDKTSLLFSGARTSTWQTMYSLPTLDVLAADINENLQFTLDGFFGLMDQLKE